MIVKKHSYSFCFLFLFAFALHANDAIVLKYGQDLDSIVSYNKQGEAVSKFRYFFDSNHLSSATIETDRGIYNYQYVDTEDNYLEDIIFSEKTSSVSEPTYSSRKIIEINSGKNAEYNYIWHNNSWEKLNGYLATYTNNLLSKTEALEGFADQWIVTGRMAYIYYTQAENASFAGKLKEIHSFADGENVSGKMEYLYTNVGGNIYLQSEVVYAVDGAGKFQKCMLTEYSYPSNNREHVIATTSYYDSETQRLIGEEKHTLSRQAGKLESHQFQVFDETNKIVQSTTNVYSYQNDDQTVEEKTTTGLTDNGMKIRQTRFSTKLFGENKSGNIVEEFLSGSEWIKKEELQTSYDTEGKPLQKELRKYTEQTKTPVSVYKTEWKYKPGIGIDSYTTYFYNESASQMMESWSFAVFYPGDGSTDPDGLKKIESDEKTHITVYPNPASESIFLSGGSREFDSPVQYSIYSLTGKLQMSGMVYVSQESISVAALASGTYLLRIAEDAKYSSCVFIKQ